MDKKRDLNDGMIRVTNATKGSAIKANTPTIDKKIPMCGKMYAAIKTMNIIASNFLIINIPQIKVSD
jgi:hypothetical protein